MRFTILRRLLIYTLPRGLTLIGRRSTVNIRSHASTLNRSRLNKVLNFLNRHISRHAINFRIRHERQIVRGRSFQVAMSNTNSKRALLLTAKRIQTTLYSQQVRSTIRTISRFTNLNRINDNLSATRLFIYRLTIINNVNNRLGHLTLTTNKDKNVHRFSHIILTKLITMTSITNRNTLRRCKTLQCVTSLIT